MKPIKAGYQIETVGDFKTMQFGVKSKNLTHLIGLIRDDIYSDKVLAVIREYSCNAYDANVMAGRGNEPIRVVLPTRFSPEFKVRDHGNGLSMQEIEDIFISYGESTKRQTNDAVGMLGIGAKSGFAYGSNYVVNSYHNGVKTVYDCAIDQTGVGCCMVLTTSKMTKDDYEGIEIVVPVRQGDIDTFRDRAVNFFKYWSVRPDIVNLDDQSKALMDKKSEGLLIGKNKDWQMSPISDRYGYNNRGNKAIALMGNIPYPIDWNQIENNVIDTNIKTILNCIISSDNFLIRFNIGDLRFAPSREALQYTNDTIKAITDRVVKVASELAENIISEIASKSTYSEAVKFYKTTFRDYGSVFRDLEDTSIFKDKMVWKDITFSASYFKKIEKLSELDRYDRVNDSRMYGPISWVDSKIDPATKQKVPVANGVGNKFAPTIEQYTVYNDAIVKTRGSMSRYNRYRGAVHFDVWNLNVDNTIILDCDGDGERTLYKNRALEYLKKKYSDVAIFYAFNMNNKEVRKTIESTINMSHFKVFKYTDIEDDIKNSIVKVKRERKKNGADYEMEVNYITPNSTGYSEKVNFLTTAGGYYVESIGFTIQTPWPGTNNSFDSVRSVLREYNNVAQNVYKKNVIEKVYVFNRSVMNNRKIAKLLKKKNSGWTSFTSVLSSMIDSIKADTKLVEDYKFNQFLTEIGMSSRGQAQMLSKLMNDSDIAKCVGFDELKKELDKDGRKLPKFDSYGYLERSCEDNNITIIKNFAGVIIGDMAKSISFDSDVDNKWMKLYNNIINTYPVLTIVIEADFYADTFEKKIKKPLKKIILDAQ